MRINNNIPALRTLHQMNKTNASMDKTMQKLSSGLRINSAGDDAAGLAIAQKMQTQVRGLEQANRNSMDGISLIQTAEGALNEVHSMLQRMRELSVQASNGTMEDADRKTIQDEIDQLVDEIDRTAQNTEYNKKKLLNGDLEFKNAPIGPDGRLDLQIGANESQMMKVEIADMGALALGLKDVANKPLDVSTTQTVAQNAITTIDNAIATVSTTRSKLGAYQNRLEHVVANLGVAAENMTESMSRIQDADMAKEMAEYTKANILAQAGNSMLAQANQRPQQILQLLQ